MRDMHSNQETCYYCSECGISKATRKQFQNHQRSHKTAVCPSCSKVLPFWNKHKHVKLYRGQVHEQRFHCDQCGKATKTSHRLEQHMICTYTLYARKFGLIVLKTFHTRNSEVLQRCHSPVVTCCCLCCTILLIFCFSLSLKSLMCFFYYFCCLFLTVISFRKSI